MDSSVVEAIRHEVAKKGFETHQFKVGWYNDVVAERFHLSYDYNTLAILLLSCPDMFELHFIPYLRSTGWCDDSRDPLDQCIAHFVSTLKQSVLKETAVDVYYDYELNPRTRQPRILMQTAGHVSGAAYFYQQCHVGESENDNTTKKTLFPVSIHPLYGGWFAFRTVLILPEIHLPLSLPMTEPFDTVPNKEDRLLLLKLFNENWKDGKYRDINKPKHSYSEIQREYFNTPPKDRGPIINKILNT